ncbi:hypothetical protein MMC08_000197 [Hypocenomyce scalaris]|nr:hypothetical protein [Hypocenomyce scalaris]
MPFTFTLPSEYGYVVLTAAASTFLGQWHGMKTTSYRKVAHVAYPTPYATEAEAATSSEKYLFNCAQRAHANYLENYPMFLTGMLISGLKYPVLSAGLGASWCVARVFYTLGYMRKDKEQGKGRMMGAWFWLPQMALGVTSGLVGWSMLGL